MNLSRRTLILLAVAIALVVGLLVLRSDDPGTDVDTDGGPSTTEAVDSTSTTEPGGEESPTPTPAPGQPTVPATVDPGAPTTTSGGASGSVPGQSGNPGTSPGGSGEPAVQTPTAAQPDPALGDRGFDTVPALRDGAGVGTPSDLEENVGDDGIRVSSVTINLTDPNGWQNALATFDPIFTGSGFVQSEATVHAGMPGYVRLLYTRSSMTCTVIYSTTFGPLYQVTCIG